MAQTWDWFVDKMTQGTEDPVHHVCDEVLQPVQELGEVNEGALGPQCGVYSASGA